MSFRPLPPHEYDAQLRRENRLRAEALVRRLNTQIRTIDEVVKPPSKCQACKNPYPLIKHGRYWLCRACAVKRDRELERKTGVMMPSDKEGQWL